MPASRVVQFDCPSCGELVELHNIDQKYIEVVIYDLGKQKRLTRCQLEALKFALVAFLDEGTGIVFALGGKEQA